MSITWHSGLRRFPPLFWIPGLLVLLLFGAGILQPDWFAHAVESTNRFIYSAFGGFYLWFAMLTLTAFVGIALSPLGRIRLGGKDAKPDHSVLSWFAMLFCAGMGTGLMFWGAAEPLYHYMNPPLWDAVAEPQRRILAFQYTFFHWGLHPWAIYGMTAMAIGFFGFNRNRGFHFSAFLMGLHRPDRAWIHRSLILAIDLLTVIAIIFGISATFGMGVLQLSGGLEALFHVPRSPWLLVALILGMTGLYLTSALKGIRMGMKILSNCSFWLYLVLLGFVIGLAPHTPVMQPMWESIPALLAKLPDMSLGWGAFRDARWVGDWTVKYWSWWIAWAPFVGIFIAFISRGRTLRELALGVMVLPTAFSCLWFAIFGQTAITLQAQTGFAGSAVNLQQVNLVLFNLVKTLTDNPLLPALCLLIIAVDFINSADGATYTVASLSAQDMETHPPIHLRVGWGILFALLTALFLLAGGIQLLQEITLITAFPFTLLLVVVYGWLIVQLVCDSRQEKVTSSLVSAIPETHDPVSAESTA